MIRLLNNQVVFNAEDDTSLSPGRQNRHFRIIDFNILPEDRLLSDCGGEGVGGGRGLGFCGLGFLQLDLCCIKFNEDEDKIQ